MKTGYTKAHRKELKSDIWKMPPLYHRVWFWLRSKAKYKVERFPSKKKYSIWLLPGQWLTSLDNIAEGVSWMEYGVEKRPNKKTIKQILDWLVFNEMVTVVSNAYGTFYSITNWDTYNCKDGEKVTVASNPKETEHGTHEHRDADTIKELQKKLEELQKNKDLKTSPAPPDEVALALAGKEKIAKKETKLSEKELDKRCLVLFEGPPEEKGRGGIWKYYPEKEGKEAARRHFIRQIRTPEKWADIQQALKNYCILLRNNPTRTPMIGSTFFNERWLDYVDYEPPEKQHQGTSTLTNEEAAGL